MYEYAIEDFLLDVYYPIENDVAMEGTDSGSGLFGKLMAIISRFIEFIRTNIIDRIKRFIRAMCSKIASESNDKFMVTQNMLNVTNTAMRYVDNGESAISSVDQMVSELYKAADTDQKRNRASGADSESDNTESAKATKKLEAFSENKFTSDEYDRFADVFESAKRAFENTDHSASIAKRDLLNAMAKFNDITKVCDNVSRKLDEELKWIRETRSQFSDEEYKTLNVFRTVSNGIGYAYRIIGNVAKFLILCQQVFAFVANSGLNQAK